jgi:hypothetical protein
MSATNALTPSYRDRLPEVPSPGEPRDFEDEDRDHHQQHHDRHARPLRLSHATGVLAPWPAAFPGAI